MGSDKDDKGFSVVDRRVTTEDEPAKGKSAGASGPAAKAEPGEKASADCLTPEEAGKDYEKAAGNAEATMPPLNFPSFLLSLHAAALLHLGVIHDPELDKGMVSLELAQQNISLLEILQDKTRGNLSADETKLLDNILYELRMAYLERAGVMGKKECKQ